MNPDNEGLEPIDPPDNTGTVTEVDPDASEAQAMAIDPPDNTGGGS
jgi:hypothetical protein